jgi:uncharacterized MAPEG superfamily protein
MSNVGEREEEMAVTLELKLLAFSVLLGLVHIVLASHSASLQRGYRWTASARDEVLPPLTGAAGRLSRASVNFLETFPFCNCSAPSAASKQTDKRKKLV